MHLYLPTYLLEGNVKKKNSANSTQFNSTPAPAGDILFLETGHCEVPQWDPLKCAAVDSHSMEPCLLYLDFTYTPEATYGFEIVFQLWYSHNCRVTSQFRTQLSRQAYATPLPLYPICNALVLVFITLLQQARCTRPSLFWATFIIKYFNYFNY